MAYISTKTFSWSVLQSLQSEQEFSWYVGDGPLYWYRVTWKEPQENCGGPQASKSEMWHVMATSTEHLCIRLKETCGRNANKYLKKIEYYDRPVLCCDVDNYNALEIPITDEYIDVPDFCNCDCLSLCDPCDCDIFCGSFELVDKSMKIEKNFSFTMDLDKDLDKKPKIYKSTENEIITKCNCSLPAAIMLHNNIFNLNLLKDFLTRNKLTLSDKVNLLYNKSSDSWANVIHLQGHEDRWQIRSELLCDKLWKFNMQISNKDKKSNISVSMLDNEAFRTKGLHFDYNFKNKHVDVKHPSLLQSKTVNDEIGIFENFILKIKLER